jgi:hypothetical protein
MADASIRRVTIAEQADAAARRTAQTGELERNPHEGTQDSGEWKRAYERYLLLHTSGEVSA